MTAPVPTPKPTGPLTVKETILAGERALVSFIAAFPASLSVITASDVKALQTAGITAGIAALISLGNTLRNYVGS